MSPPTLRWTTPARRRPAFTLIELLIVASLLAAIAILAMPSGAQAEHEKLRAGVRLLSADLGLAQQLSMGNGADPCVVVFHADGLGYHIARASDPATPIDDPVMKGPLLTRFGEARAARLGGVTIQGWDLDGDDRLAFTAAGALDQPNSAELRVGAGGTTMTLRVDPVTGEVATE